jgi:hypothetical protein
MEYFLEIPVMNKFFFSSGKLSRAGVTVQSVSEPEIYHGAGFILGAGAGVRV